jgi:hypothetical protein
MSLIIKKNTTFKIPRTGSTAPAGIPSSASSLHAYFQFYGVMTFGSLNNPIVFSKENIDPSGSGYSITFSNYQGYPFFITWTGNSWAVGVDYGKGFVGYMYTKNTYMATSSFIPTDPAAWNYNPDYPDYTTFVITA